MKYLNCYRPVTAYIASGWFNAEEEQARQEILEVLNRESISYFSPKDEVLIGPNSTLEERQAAFKADTEIIKHCDFVVASTVGKDMGTLMEMGMAYAWDTPVIVYFPAPEGTPCNLMIAESAYAVAKNPTELEHIIANLKSNCFDFSKRQTYNSIVE